MAGATAIRRIALSAAAFFAAVGVHAAFALGLYYMPEPEVIPPQVVGGFEVVDLSAFGVAVVPEPEPVEEKPVEAAKVEPLPEAEPEPEPEPEPEVIPEPEPNPEVAEPAPLPKPKPKPEPKPKPVAKPKPQPKPVQKVEAKPQPKPKPKPKPKPEASTSVGSQSAYVPPTSSASYLRNPKPAYPTMARRRGMQGTVVLFVQVSAKGTPVSVTVKKGSGYAVLDKEALRAVRSWRFTPASKGGLPIAAGVEVPIRFSLNDV